jgi:hypothetical protein
MLQVVCEVLTMRFHLTGLIVFVAFLVLALVGGAGPAVAVVRFAMVIFGVAALVEVVVNMVRHRDFRVRSRLLGLLGDQGSFFQSPPEPQSDTDHHHDGEDGPPVDGDPEDDIPGPRLHQRLFPFFVRQ